MEGPVSWLLIRPGWKVYASDGDEVGRVDEVAGDDTQDIFDGLALATSALGKPLYVRAEQVAEISEGAVRLSLTHEQVMALDEYREPATSAMIEPDSKGGLVAEAAGELRKVEGLVRPVQRHERSMNVWQRMYLAVRRLLGR